MQKMRYVAVMVLLAVWASLLASASSVAAQQGSGEGGGAYPDTPADAYFAEPVAQLKDRGVFEGTLCGDGFCPSDPIDRKTVAVWVVRMLDGEDPPAVSESRFDDVDSAGFHARFIERVAVLGVTRGCGDGSGFCPDRHMTRAEMAVFLSRAYSLGDGPDPAFSDVPADAWYAADVARLANAGITVGCGDGTRFCPGQDTTRAQMATFLHRADNPDRIEEPGIAGDAISIGASHGCAVKADQTIACWGDNTHGQASPPAGRFAAVAVESTYSCALRTDKTVVCWGENSRGRTDAPSGTYTNISASPHHPCALHTDGTIRCWGSSTVVYPGGQYTERPPRGTFTDISLSKDLGCAIKTDQSITCWGWTSQLGATPTGSFVAVDVHYRLACALRSDLTITCWGRNPHGQSDAPSGIHTAIATGRRHACALASDQRITCWGDQDDPQRVGAANVRNYGLTNAPIGTYRSIATTAWQTCALRDDDTYTCWGSSTPIDEDTVASSPLTVVVSPATLTITEGTAASYSIKLAAEPIQPITITVTPPVGQELSVNPASITFNKSNWSELQYVTITAGQDEDNADDIAVIVHSVMSAEPTYRDITVASFTAVVQDDDVQDDGTPEPPGAPRNVRIEWLEGHSLTVHWQAPETGGDGSLYAVDRSVAGEVLPSVQGRTGPEFVSSILDRQHATFAYGANLRDDGRGNYSYVIYFDSSKNEETPISVDSTDAVRVIAYNDAGFAVSDVVEVPSRIARENEELRSFVLELVSQYRSSVPWLGEVWEYITEREAATHYGPFEVKGFSFLNRPRSRAYLGRDCESSLDVICKPAGAGVSVGYIRSHWVTWSVENDKDRRS